MEKFDNYFYLQALFGYKLFYWSIFLPPIIASLNFISIKKKLSNSLYIFYFVFLALMVGTRLEVGGDWGIYLHNFFSNGTEFDIFNFKIRSDWGYEIFSYLIYANGFTIIHLNILAAFFSFYCLFLFSKQYNNKWLLLSIAYPYLIIIVFMGFSRQSLALSFIFLTLISANKGNYKLVLLYSILGILFHKSSLLYFLIILISSDKIIGILFKNFILVTFIAFITFYSFSDMSNMIGVYLIKPEAFFSSGAFPRYLLTFIAAVIFLLNRKKFNFSNFEYRFCLFNSILVLFLSLLLIKYSTFVDRVLIYFIPFQILIFVNVAYISKYKRIKNFINYSVLLLFMAYFFVHTNFSNNFHRWGPYNSILFGNKINYHEFLDDVISCEDFNDFHPWQYIKNECI